MEAEGVSLGYHIYTKAEVEKNLRLSKFSFVMFVEVHSLNFQAKPPRQQ